MSPDALESIRSRIRRAEAIAHQPAATGFEQTHTLEDGKTHEYSVSGIKSPEQLEDELLALFVWTWSLKDHLKEFYKARKLEPRHVETVVNQHLALQYVADIANRAKHGVLRESRSGKFAELVDVGFTVPQTAIDKITVGAFSVEVEVSRTLEVELHAYIKTIDGQTVDAFGILAEAISIWEAYVIAPIAA